MHSDLHTCCQYNCDSPNVAICVTGTNERFQSSAGYLVEVDGFHESSSAEVGQFQQVLPLLLDVVDAVLNLLRSKVVGFDEVVADLQYRREVRVARIQLILVRLHPDKSQIKHATSLDNI